MDFFKSGREKTPTLGWQPSHKGSKSLHGVPPGSIFTMPPLWKFNCKKTKNLVELHSQYEKIIMKRIFVAFGVPFKRFSLSILFSPCSLPILLCWSLLAWYLTLLVFLSGICVCMFVWVYVNLSCIYVYRLYISLNQLLTCTYREGDTRTFKHFLRGVILLHIKFEDC